MPTTRRGGLVLSEEKPRSRTRRAVTKAVLAVFAVGLAGAGYVGAQGVLHNLGGPRCQATALGKSVDFDPSQTRYAATITSGAAGTVQPIAGAAIAFTCFSTSNTDSRC